MVIDCVDDFLEIVRLKSVEYNIYIWGTGVYGNLIGKLLNNNNIDWKGYYDNYSFEKQNELNGKAILNGHFNTPDTSKNCIFILSMRKYSVLKNQLISAGYTDNNIICFENIEFFNQLDDICINDSQYSSKIKSFKNIHKSQRCFIIGNGPSLILDDLNKIYNNNDISFASNFIFRCYDKTCWRPDYYFFIDNNGISEFLKDKQSLKYVSENCKYIFSRSNGGLNEYMDVINNLYFFKSIYSKSETIFDFSSDCSEKLYIGYTVTYAMLQMAVYMGFKEIYLLGIDHNFSHEMKADGTIVYNNGVKDHSNLLEGHKSAYYDIDRTTKAYISAKKYADENEIKIYNATRGGKLEVFPRIDFDSLF